MTPAEIVWLSGLGVGLLAGLPLGIIFDRLFLRPSVRFLSQRTHDEGA